MEKEKFIQFFAAQFENTDVSNFSAETKFRELEEWSSFLALSIMAMADEEYNVKLKGEDIRVSQSINDLYEIVKSRI